VNKKEFKMSEGAGILRNMESRDIRMVRKVNLPCRLIKLMDGNIDKKVS